MDPRSSDEALQREIPSFIEPRPPSILNPFMRPRPEKGIELFAKCIEDSDIEEEPELLQVYLRLKPCKVLNNLYELRSDKCLVTSLDTTTAGHGRRTQHNVSKLYTFSRIFDEECSQKEIFEQVVKNNLKRLVDGYSFTLLTYGASGSGKTYTVMGTVNSPGFVPRALEYLFALVDAAQTPIFKPSENGTDQLSYAQQDSELQCVKRLLAISAPFRDKYRRMSVQLHSDLTVSSVDLSNRTKHYVWVSFVEIYNEAIYDLLAPPGNRVKLRLREDSSGNVYVKGVTQAFVRSGAEAYDVMVAGKHNLIVAATGIHAQSSRSHCIFTITMLTEKDGEIRASHVRLCDLAGCERQQAARNTGTRMLESRAINSSLHVLERCLHMLRRKQITKDSTIVPYRECKLTRLLGSGLSGARGEAVTMMVTINPAPQHAHVTRHVLSLAVLAKDIHVNNTIDPTTTMSSLECTQETTMQDYSEELMRLRADNERLHFEILQAQSCNAQLRRSMEEKQQKTANTMQELVEETKDMARQFYERQLNTLRSQRKEMEKDYENRLAEMAEDYENRLAEMAEDYENRLAEMAEKLNRVKGLDLEDKRSSERVTRELTKIQRRSLCNFVCIDEREENEYEGRESPNLVPEYSTDSDNDSESDADLDESLEPVKQIRKSILNKEIPAKYEAVINLINESKEVSDNDDTENDMNNDDPHDGNASNDMNNDDPHDGNASNELLAHDDNSVAISKDSMYATGDDDSQNESKQCENAIESPNLNVPVFKMIDKDLNVEVVTDKYAADTDVDKDKSECEEMFNVSTKLDKTQEVTEITMPTNRGTYFVSHEPQKESNVIYDTKLKTLNAARGTYFVADREISFLKETYIEDDKNNKELKVNNKEMPVKSEEFLIKNKETLTEFVKPQKAAETLVSKIIKSFKGRQSSESSLRQFEQLEQAFNNTDNSTDAVKSIDIPIHTQLTKKNTYFDDTAKEFKINKISNNEEINKPAEERDDKQSKYFEDKPDNPGCAISDPQKSKNFKDKLTKSNTCQLSSNAKIQEKRLLLDSPETTSTSPEKDKSQNLENDKTISLILTPKIVKKAQLYFTDNDKVIYNDILISKSPSIVKGDTIQEYEPSIAMKKILGESFTKPEILSSIRKDRLASKKHESVDIFDSPLSSITKASSKEISNIELTATKNVKEPDNIRTEIVSATKLKERAGEIAHEFVESLVASQKIKMYSKLEELAKSSVKQESKIHDLNIEKTNLNTEDIKQEVSIEKTYISEQSTTAIDKDNNAKETEANTVSDNETKLNHSDAQPSNNTVDEFENIVKDLTNVRATDFELLVDEETGPANIKSPQEQDTDVNTKEKNARRNKFEEAKYNLRNKKSNHNVSDEKKDTTDIPEYTKSRSITKRCLRLRRRKNEDNPEQDTEGKLKDIVNLEKEFSDVTLGLPVVKKEVKDIPSPEKLPGEEENVPPMLGIQSCPSKSVTRSRRKLFTPRAEPLEESPSQAGDSNERLYVPRPSYHRARARRRL